MSLFQHSNRVDINIPDERICYARCFFVVLWTWWTWLLAVVGAEGYIWATVRLKRERKNYEPWITSCTVFLYSFVVCVGKNAPTSPKSCVFSLPCCTSSTPGEREQICSILIRDDNCALPFSFFPSLCGLFFNTTGHGMWKSGQLHCQLAHSPPHKRKEKKYSFFLLRNMDAKLPFYIVSITHRMVGVEQPH